MALKLLYCKSNQDLVNTFIHVDELCWYYKINLTLPQILHLNLLVEWWDLIWSLMRPSTHFWHWPHYKYSVVTVKSHEFESYLVCLSNILLTLPLLLPFWLLNLFHLRLIASEKKYQHSNQLSECEIKANNKFWIWILKMKYFDIIFKNGSWLRAKIVFSVLTLLHLPWFQHAGSASWNVCKNIFEEFL